MCLSKHTQLGRVSCSIFAVVNQRPKPKDAVVVRNEHLTLLKVPLGITNLIVCKRDPDNGLREAVASENFTPQRAIIDLP
jgi:hypothetical protein